MLLKIPPPPPIRSSPAATYLARVMWLCHMSSTERQAKFFPVKASAFSGCVCCTKYLRNTAWVLISFDSHEKKPEKRKKKNSASVPIEFYDFTNETQLLTTSGNVACGRGTAQWRERHRIV